MPKTQAVGILFTPIEITINAAKSGACYLSSLAPETLGAWCGSLKVKKLSTVFAFDRFDLWWILFGHCRFKVSFMKCSGTEFVR